MEQDIKTFEQLLNISEQTHKPIYEIFQEREAILQECSVEDVRTKVQKTILAMKESIKNGLASSEKSISNLCGDGCKKLQIKYSKKSSVLGKLYGKVLTYAIATIEENLRMGKIVACPTAGSCGILPAVIIAFSEEYNISQEEQINALITAGAIATIISYKVALAGAVAGCQAECGVASAMSAAALTYLFHGNTKQIINAVALSLKNIMGLTCDPVAGMVEIPCVKRNAFLAIHAITAFELSDAGIESAIPADEVVDAMLQTGELMSPLLKESSQAGLAKTKTAIKIEQELREKFLNK